ncbi:MAG TPA: PHP domain-containing protein [Ktedonosporobacter sp.]|nr:PHP domain-containing protein [Ktedonosporobacter sp.]
MTLDTDFHNHVVRSSAAQMVQSAQQKGLRVLGLSEHVFQMNEAHAPLQHMKLEGPMLSLPTYIQAIHSAAQEAQIEVRLGLEVDFVPEINQLIHEPLQGLPWDFLIGSIHEVDGDVFERGGEPTQEEGEALWLRYLELLRAAVNSGYFQVVSHPVRMRVKNPHLPATLADEYEHLAADAARRNVALELNGFDILRYPEMVQLLAKACVLHHTPISVGSDAHNPTEIARAHQQTLALMREAGISTVRIWKQRVSAEYTL